MNTRGKAVLAAMTAQRPVIKAGSMPPSPDSGVIVGTSGRQLPRIVPRPGWEGFSTLADELNMWLSGDLSFLSRGGPMTAGRTAGTGKPDAAKRKREVTADVLDRVRT